MVTLTKYNSSGCSNWRGPDSMQVILDVTGKVNDELLDLIEASLDFVDQYGIEVTVEFSYGGSVFVIRNQ